MHTAMHSALCTLHAARTLHRRACTRKTRSEHAAHMHAYVTVCTWEGGSGSTYICVHAYMTVCTREHLHTHARVRDCVSATVAHVSLCACSVCVLCDVTASNTRESFTDGESCIPRCTLHSARCTLHAHCIAGHARGRLGVSTLHTCTHT